MRVPLLLVLMFLAGTAVAQHWKRIGRGSIGVTQVNQIMADTLEDRLLICGNFNYFKNEEDTIRCGGTAQWRGTRWDTLAQPLYLTSSNVVGSFYWLTRFNNLLYASGPLGLPNDTGLASGGFARLNETNLEWEDLECAQPYYGSLSHLMPKETAGQPFIYATGYSWSLCGYPAACVYRYSGTSFEIWEPWSQIPTIQGDYVSYVFDFRGLTYMCGEFANPIGSGFRYFMRHNGSSWEEVPGWGPGIVKDYTIYRDTLYVVGAFQTANGGPGNGIAAFDGVQWQALGNGLSLTDAPQFTSVLTLRWFQDELFVGGQFNTASGIPSNGFAKWNRSQWCSLPGFDAQSFATGMRRVESMAVWRDSLYIEGSFGQGLEGQDIRQLAHWIGGNAVTACSDPVSVSESFALAPMSVQPNPTDGLLRLDRIPSAASRIEIRDGLGRLVLVYRWPAHTVDIGSLPAGAYHLVLKDNLGAPLARASVVKQ